MEKEILKGEIGTEGEYRLDIIGGAAKVQLTYKGAQATSGFFVTLSIVHILEEAAKSTENKIDDALVALIKGALGE